MRALVFSFLLFVAVTVNLLADNVNLFWDANSETDVTSYNVHRAGVSGGPYIVVGTAPQISNPTFSDSGVDLTTDKFYVVTAVNVVGDESGFSNEVQVSAPPPSVPPNAPGGLIVTVTIVVSP